MSVFGNSSEWPLVPLKGIATLKRGYDLPVSQREEGNIPIYAANGKNGTHSEAKIVGPGVITGRSGTIGKVHYSEGDYWPLNTSLYVTSFHGNDPRWVFYMLKAFRLERFSEGAGVPTLNRNLVHDELIPLPPLAEQQRIAAILDKADAIRRKRQQAIQLADDFLSAQFLKKFGDPKDSPFGSKSLKDVALKITDGAHFTPTYVDSGIPFLRVTDINGDEVDWSKVKYIPLEEHQELIKRCKPEKGDVLYSKNGTIGVPRLIDWDQEFSIFVSLCLIKPNPKYLRGRYLYSFLQTPFALKQAIQKAKSATVTNLHLVEIKEIKLPVPSLAIQDEWIDFVDNFGCMRARLIESLNKSNDSFNSISQKAFRGEL